MKPTRYFIIILLAFFSCKDTITEDQQDYTIAFETSKGEETATYQELIDFYLTLAKDFPEINVQTIGETDCGHPLHLATYNPEGNFNFQKIRENKSILLINNGIHPGEPDGIDATMLLFRALAQKTISIPKNTVIATIPVYNVGGMLNRNSHTRINQNGPVAYGFRGNARNFDLNRDFIKTDTKNAATFANIFHLVQPDVFIDNHVSNGADYQYTLTHLFTQHNKLGGALGQYLHQELMPNLEKALQTNQWDITPYVNVFNRPPEGGFTQFMDHPRYSTGYTTLWNTLGLMVETHMLKPYKQRVEGTYELMANMIALTDKDHKKIKTLRAAAQENLLKTELFLHNWAVDSTKTSTLNFKGYQADTIQSAITGLPRLKYNRDQPLTAAVTYRNYFYPKDTIKVPAAYVVKKQWKNVIERLETNKIDFFALEKDTVLTLETYKIASFKTSPNPYEGHYPHRNTKVTPHKAQIGLTKGDFIVPTQQKGLRYLLATLEPEAMDSFFNWNFFDAILQQKEGFSPYVFEDLALTILDKNPALKDSLIAKKATDENFANNWYAQLDYILKNSAYYEKAHRQYPIYRIAKGSPAAGILIN